MYSIESLSIPSDFIPRDCSKTVYTFHIWKSSKAKTIRPCKEPSKPCMTHQTLKWLILPLHVITLYEPSDSDHWGTLYTCHRSDIKVCTDSYCKSGLFLWSHYCKRLLPNKNIRIVLPIYIYNHLNMLTKHNSILSDT